ncbi:hypothetical protein OF83DRAFT_1064486 [Amylostereum chailletii]|nr:hypothetical protein OF83DRAFT_1064486 [Amylostereum chailletii]
MSHDTQKRTFVAWCPDYTDATAFERRLSLRPKHLEGIRKLIATGAHKYGGVTLDSESTSAKMNGSTMVLEADSLKDVQAVIESDPYWEGNVWDKDKVVIRPILLGGPSTSLGQ